MKVLITTHGSTGDVVPFIGLALAFQNSGHDVRFATASYFQKDVEEAGLSFYSLPPDWGEAEFQECMRELNRSSFPIGQFRTIYKSGLTFIDEAIEKLDEALRSADILISSILSPYYRGLAERHKKPFAVVNLCHMLTPTVAAPPYPTRIPKCLPEGVQKTLNRFSWKVAGKVLDFTIANLLGEHLRRLQLSVPNNFLREPAALVLIAVSPLVYEHYPPLDARHIGVGYFRWQVEDDLDLEQELTHFCFGEEVPVLTFGSVTSDGDKEAMEEFLVRWSTNKKIIIQEGWAGFSDRHARPNVKVVPKMSHDQLFRHASCVIHHGGAGTTASVFHSGKPQIVIPHIADQHFWAREVERLGVGRRLEKRNWPRKLATELATLGSDCDMISKSEMLAQQMRFENGPETAVKVIEAFAEQYSS